MHVYKFHPVLQELMCELSSQDVGPLMRLRRALGLQRRFMTALTTLAQPFGGQLAVSWRKFSTQGTRKIAYQASVVSLRRHTILHDSSVSIRSQSGKNEGPNERLTDSLLERFLIPVDWQQPLYCHETGKRGAIKIVLEGRRGYEVPVPQSFSQSYLNVSGLEDVLFRKPVYEDRRQREEKTLEAVLILGTKSVREWFSQHHSISTYEKLMEFHRQTA